MSAISTYSQSDAIRSGWNNERVLERNQHNPAQLTGLRDQLVTRIVALQGGTANSTNVLAALQGDASVAAAEATIGAL